MAQFRQQINWKTSPQTLSFFGNFEEGTKGGHYNLGGPAAAGAAVAETRPLNYNTCGLHAQTLIENRCDRQGTNPAAVPERPKATPPRPGSQ